MCFAYGQVERFVLEISLAKPRVTSQATKVAGNISEPITVTDTAEQLIPLIKNLVDADVKVIVVVRLGAVGDNIVENSRLVGCRVEVQQLDCITIQAVGGKLI